MAGLGGRPSALLVLAALLLAVGPFLSAHGRGVSLASGGEDLFRQALLAAARGQNERAITLLEQARARGFDEGKVLYNIGVLRYRHGELTAAESAFTSLRALRGWEAPAAFNLGAIAEDRDQRRRAVSLFLAAYRQADTAALRREAAGRLQALGTEPTPAQWEAQLETRAGYDDNLGVSDAADGFIEASTEAGYRLYGTRDSRLYARGGLLHRGYLEESDFSQTAIRVGMAYDQRNPRWEWRITGDGTAYWLGGDRVQQAGDLGFQAGRRLGQGDYVATADVQISAIEGLSRFDYLSGWRLGAGFGMGRRWPTFEAGAGYRWVINDRDDRRASFSAADRDCVLLGLFCLDAPAQVSEFESFSPQRHGLYLQAKWLPSYRWSLSVRLDYERSRFDDAARVSVNGTRAVESRRRDVSWQASLEARRRLTTKWSMVAGYSHTDQDSNFGVYDYRRSQVSAGLRVVF